ncbi:MAG: hypothetical protein MRY83_07875 [Flavobacteriales bacterium]|nr:hypothetical protein [Flavobacteriales bacterium]
MNKRLGLLNQRELALSIDPKVVYQYLPKFIEKGSYSLLADPFEAFKNHKQPYRGHFDEHSFKIRRKRKAFELFQYYILTRGNIQSSKHGTIVDFECNGFSRLIVILILLVSLVHILTFVILPVPFEQILFIGGISIISLSILWLVYFLLTRSAVKTVGDDIQKKFELIEKAFEHESR